MVLRTAAARRALALIGVVAVVLTPAAGEPVPQRDASETVFAATLAPSDHPALTKGPVPSVAKPVWTTTAGPPALLGALIALVTVTRRRHGDRGVDPARLARPGPPAGPDPIPASRPGVIAAP
jgi:hypothetical protein